MTYPLAKYRNYSSCIRYTHSHWLILADGGLKIQNSKIVHRKQQQYFIVEALNSVKCRGLVIISDKRGFEIFRRGLMLEG